MIVRLRDGSTLEGDYEKALSTDRALVLSGTDWNAEEDGLTVVPERSVVFYVTTREELS